MPFGTKLPGQLADRRRLPRTVYAHHQDHERPTRHINPEWFGHGCKHFLQLFAQGPAQCAGVGEFLARYPLRDRIDDPPRGIHTDIRPEQRRLEFLQRVLIDRALAQQQVARNLREAVSRPVEAVPNAGAAIFLQRKLIYSISGWVPNGADHGETNGTHYRR